LGVVARVAGRQAGRSRTLSAIWSAVRATVRSFAHVLHQLWLEVTGTLFLAIAFFGAVALAREYMKYEAGRTTASRVAIAGCFTLTFGWFGLTSFWRVKKKGQRP
jgi:F0F1-type ATP synthase membrane subunit a